MAITALLGDVAAIVKGKRPGQVNIDNKIFQLHYRFTTFLFLGSSILSTTNSLIGNPINCACADCLRAGIDSNVVDTHCWISGTYTLPERDFSFIGLEKEFRGLGTPAKEDGRKYHMYYQWVPFVLFMQGIMFYIPHWMWEINEDGRVSALVHDLRLPTMEKEELRKRVANLTTYVVETLGSYDGYYLRFLVCDMMNIVIVFANIFFTDRFINHEFLSYGPRCFHYLSNSSTGLVNPMTETFPKLTKCTLQTFGASGTVQNLDAICVLALNIFNEKLYLILWFWLVTLAIVTLVVFVLRMLFMLVRRFRSPQFQRKAHTIHTNDIEDVVGNIRIGDFFFITLLSKNLDITAFRMFLSQLSKAMKRRKYGARGRHRRPSATPSEPFTIFQPQQSAPSPRPRRQQRPTSPRQRHHQRPSSPRQQPAGSGLTEPDAPSRPPSPARLRV